MKHYRTFACLALLLLLTAPFWVVWLPGYSPKDKWLEAPPGPGNFSFFAEEAYEKTDDIDIAVLGTSLMWCALDTDQVQERLSKELNRPAVVESFAANSRGEEFYYLQLKELTAHRRIKMLIFDMPVEPNFDRDTPHPMSPYLWVLGEHLHDMRDARAAMWFKFYASSVIGTPRHFLSRVRANGIMPYGQTITNRSRTGSRLDDYGFGFTAFHPPAQPISEVFPPEQVILSPSTAAQYSFNDRQLNPFQTYFLKKFFALAAEKHIHVVIMRIPTFANSQHTAVEELTDYRTTYPGRIDMASIPPSWLFGKLNDEQTKDYFYDEHMNTSGSKAFTRALLPSILTLYAKEPAHEME